MRRTVLISIAILFGFFVLLWAQQQAEAPSVLDNSEQAGATLSTGKATILVELAITGEERILGLGGREALAPNTGMLFVFPHPALQGIWMKGMKFPLDVLWLEEERADMERGKTRLRVVDVKENIALETFPKVFFPKAKASYVLEMNGGSAKSIGISVGSVLTLQK